MFEKANEIEKIDTFKAGDGFLVDVVTNKSCYEAWLYHAIYGIKDFMFGLPKEQQSYEEALEIIKNNVLYEGYKEYYMEEYFD